MSLRGGFTTGVCAAVGAKAAALLFCKGVFSKDVDIKLPDGETVNFAIKFCAKTKKGALACSVKDAGDDPDITNKMLVITEIEPANEDLFEAGEGIGIVSKLGLSIPVGEPAINLGPRKLIIASLREVTAQKFKIKISIPEASKIADKTFNPKLGIVGGISILGTTGRVRPYSHEAIKETMRCCIDVIAAIQKEQIVCVPGNIGAKAVCHFYNFSKEILVEVGNAWGYAFDIIKAHGFKNIVIAGHPGKLAKLLDNVENTHSKFTKPPFEKISQIIKNFGIEPINSVTVEGIFAGLEMDMRLKIGNILAEKIVKAVETRIGISTKIFLVNMHGELLGSCEE